MSSILPGVGTVYSSLPAFKLDVFERGLQQSLRLTTKASSPNNFARLHCGIRIGRPSEKQYCSFRVVAKNVKGVITVTDIETEHSCEGPDTELKRLTARNKMLEMVGKARREKEEFEKRGEHQGQEAMSDKGQIQDGGSIIDRFEHKANEDEFEQESEEDDEDFGSDLSTRQYQSSALPSKGDYLSDEDAYSDYSPSSDSEEDLGPQSTFVGSPSSSTSTATTKPRNRGRRMSTQDLKKMFPPTRDIESEIKELRKSEIVNLPPPATTFDTPRQLLVVLYSFALERNFSIYRKYPDSTIAKPSTLRMHCHRNATKYGKSSRGCCQFAIHATRNQNGTWSVESASGVHNHEVLEISDMPKIGSQGVKRKIDDAETSNPQLSLPNPSRSSLNSSFTNSHSTSQASRISPSRSRQLPLLPSLDPIPSTYSSDLVSFLRSFRSSPTNLPHLLNKLHTSGVNSLETLLEILMMEDESLELFVRMLNDEGVGKKLSEMVQEMRSENGLA